MIHEHKTVDATVDLPHQAIAFNSNLNTTFDNKESGAVFNKRIPLKRFDQLKDVSNSKVRASFMESAYIPYARASFHQFDHVFMDRRPDVTFYTKRDELRKHASGYDAYHKLHADVVKRSGKKIQEAASNRGKLQEHSGREIFRTMVHQTGRPNPTDEAKLATEHVDWKNKQTEAHSMFDEKRQHSAAPSNNYFLSVSSYNVVGTMIAIFVLCAVLLIC